MAHPSPLASRHTAADAMTLPYGPPDAPIDVPAAFDAVELEYAALRKGCVLADAPQRATLEITGADRLKFLDAMITQKTRDLKPFQSGRSFWLDRKGKIIADLRLTQLPDRMLVDIDPFTIEQTIETLTGFVFAEDVELTDETARLHRLWLMGPTAARLLELAAEHTEGQGPAPTELERDEACIVQVAGTEVVVERTDLIGALGLELTLPADRAADVWDHLIEIGRPPALDPETGRPSAEPTPTQAEIRLRPAGWLAINTARIEAGISLFNLDFGPTSRPGETAVLRDRVDFKKGCYLGQEVVARMDSRGAFKQRVSAIRFDAPALNPTDPHAPPPIPVAGAPVFAEGDDTPVGIITSSTVSPMLGAAPIAIATLKADATEPGTRLRAPTDAGPATGTVQASMQFWPPAT